MNTPICDFAKKYAQSGISRLHMPGHKGKGSLCEHLDLTEIAGADELYDADGTPIESAPHPLMEFYTRLPKEAAAGDILRAGE